MCNYFYENKFPIFWSFLAADQQRINYESHLNIHISRKFVETNSK